MGSYHLYFEFRGEKAVIYQELNKSQNLTLGKLKLEKVVSVVHQIASIDISNWIN